ncbi:MAG TPA: DnaJ domain-containing protein [Ilumatobacter sp.]
MPGTDAGSRRRPGRHRPAGALASPAVGPYAAGIATHYETLGVAADAPPAAIRAAYRECARRSHPDRAAGGTGAASAPLADMAAVNEAYRVLGDPGRRALYDRGLAGDVGDVAEAPPRDHPVGATAGRAGDRLAPAGPARLPWKLMAVAATVGSVVVFVTAAFNDPPSVEPPDGIIRAGSCVTIEANGDAREVACAGTPDDVVVELLITTGATCPPGLAAHRDRLGLGTACIPFD